MRFKRGILRIYGRYPFLGSTKESDSWFNEPARNQMHFDLQPKQSLKDYFPEASMAKSTVKSLFCQLNNGTSIQHIGEFCLLLVICLLNHAQNIRKLSNPSLPHQFFSKPDFKSIWGWVSSVSSSTQTTQMSKLTWHMLFSCKLVSVSNIAFTSSSPLKGSLQ